MAHSEQIRVVENCVRNIFRNSCVQSVLEVGSWSKHGGDFRYLFPSSKYIGIDVSEGPGVDLVCKGEDASFPSNYFDFVLSTECFEHNRYWRESLANMIRMCKPGGGIVITCAGLGRPEHGTSRTSISASLTSSVLRDDYYSNLSFADFQKTGLLGSLADYKYAINIETCDFYFVGIKKNHLNPSLKLPLNSRIMLNNFSGMNQKPPSFLVKAKYFALTSIERLIGERRYHSLRFIHQKSGFSFGRPWSIIPNFRNN